MSSNDDEIDGLRRQLRSLSDRLEISELFDRYVGSLDTVHEARRDDAWYRSVFTDDVRLSFPIGDHHGVAGFAAFQRAAREEWQRVHHVSANHTVDVHGDRATVRAQQLATHVHHGNARRTHFTVGGHYLGQAVRTPAGWRLNQLTFQVTWTTGPRLPSMTGVEF